MMKKIPGPFPSAKIEPRASFVSGGMIRYLFEHFAQRLHEIHAHPSHHQMHRYGKEDIDDGSDSAGQQSEADTATERDRNGRTLHIQVGSQHGSTNHPRAAKTIERAHDRYRRQDS